MAVNQSPNSRSNPQDALKLIRDEFNELLEKHRHIVETRIEAGLKEYLALYRQHYMAADARAAEDRRLCRALLKKGRLWDDIQKGQLWDNGHFQPLLVAPIAAKVRSTGELSLDTDEAAEVAARCLEWDEFQQSLAMMNEDRTAIEKAFADWRARHAKESESLLSRLGGDRVRGKAKLKSWESKLREKIKGAKADHAATKQTRKSAQSLLADLQSMCEFHSVEITPRFVCSVIHVPKRPLDLSLQDYQCLDERKGLDLCFARLAGLSDVFRVPPRWTNEERVTTTETKWYTREVDALLSLRPIKWGSTEDDVPELDPGALPVEFAAAMLRSVRAEVLEVADWISAPEVMDLCGFTASQLQMAANRGKIASQLRSRVRWYRRSDLRREYPKETHEIL